jgi:energy-coupling factor transporter ATP-binding protein EcfA2
MHNRPLLSSTRTQVPVQSGTTLPIRWEEGEHVSVVGDTGTGKSYLIRALIRPREYVVFLRTKSDDIKLPGYDRRTKASAMNDLSLTRILLQPDGNSKRAQANEAWNMLDIAWQHGGWTIVIDELWYAVRLGLAEPIERLLTQGRSKGISVVCGMQRPVGVTRFAMAESTHMFTFVLEGRDIKTFAEASTPRIVPAIQQLREHNFAYYNRRKRVVAVGNARQLQRVIIDGTTDQNHDGSLTAPAPVGQSR